MAAPSPTPAAATWIVEVVIARDVTLPSGETMPRDDFLEAVWVLLEDTGLAGVHEGSLDTATAFAEGLADAPQVIDAAAAPDRDWAAARRLAEGAFWFADQRGAREAAARLVGVVGCAVVAIRAEEGRDWEAEFRTLHGPVAVEGFGTVASPWHAPAPGPSTVIIDPGIGFGTGAHATTRLCLAALAAALPERGGQASPRVLDLGTGSGILAIAAALRGAEADAVDVDERVHPAIVHNARLNGVEERIRVARSLEDVPPGRHDVVLANIVPAVLVAHAARLVERTAPAGTLVLSGMRSDDVAAVTACFTALGAPEPFVSRAEGWQCFVFRFPGRRREPAVGSG